jgi:hypothetical protein
MWRSYLLHRRWSVPSSSMPSLTNLNSRSAANGSRSSIEFFRLPWTGCVLKDPAKPRWLTPIENLLFGIITRCLRYVGEPVDVRAGLLSKGHVWAIISSVCREMDEIKNDNELWRGAQIVTQAAYLGLALQASHFSRGTWIACCPRDKPHPRTAAKAKSILLRLLQSRRRHRRTRQVRCPEKECGCGFHRRTNLALTYQNTALTPTGI